MPYATRIFVVALIGMVLMAAAQRAQATPYQISYEGDVFPEDAGWQRFTSGGGATRTLDNGILRLEAQNPAPDGGSDQYLFDREEMLDADPGEMFFAEWRMRLLPGSGSGDVIVFIATDGFTSAFSADYAVSIFRSSRDNQSVFLDATVFHTYRMESLDMVDYTMLIDGEVAWEGFFATGTTLTSSVVFGDGFPGTASGSEWDYFRFGTTVIPEPRSIVFVVMGALVLMRRHKSACAQGQ